MAINFATKYSKQIDQVFTHESFVAGKTNGSYEFTGVKGVKIYNPVTVEPGDYTRSGANRYGTPAEMQDTVQELVISQDKGFTLTVDKGNNAEQNEVKNAAQMLRMQLAERVTPMVDKYALMRFAHEAGVVAGVGAALTKDTVLEAINKAAVAFDNALAPTAGRYLFLGASGVGLVRDSASWLAPDTLAEKALTKGVVGEIFGFAVVKVPDSYLPAGCQFVAFQQQAVMLPKKMEDAKLHQDPPGISGALLEGRVLYDAFVLAQKANAVYSCVLASNQQSAPSITVSSGSATMTSAGADAIYYTTDGSDPRYSASALPYSAGVTVASGTLLRAVARAEGKYPSNVTEKTA